MESTDKQVTDTTSLLAAGLPIATPGSGFEGLVTWPQHIREPQNGWTLTTDHFARWGVLVSPDGEAYGPGDLLTTAQVAELRGCTEGSVRLAVHRGSLPATKFGAALAIRAADALRGKRYIR